MKGTAVLVSSYLSPKVVKGRPSAIEGRGLMAVSPIVKDEIVAIKGGHIVDTATLRGLPAQLQNSDVQIADGFHSVALDNAEYESVMLFLNHSCEPNVGFAGNIVLVASPQCHVEERDRVVGRRAGENGAADGSWLLSVIELGYAWLKLISNVRHAGTGEVHDRCCATRCSDVSPA